jgi:hypothetical protein
LAFSTRCHVVAGRGCNDMLRHALTSLLHWDGVVNVVAAAAPRDRCCCDDMTTHSADNTTLVFIIKQAASQLQPRCGCHPLPLVALVVFMT